MRLRERSRDKLSSDGGVGDGGVFGTAAARALARIALSLIASINRSSSVSAASALDSAASALDSAAAAASHAALSSDTMRSCLLTSKHL